MAGESIKWGYVLAAPGRPSRKEQIAHLVAAGIADDEFGPIWDGNLVCKASRKWLVSNGLAAQASGFNFLTGTGVDMAVSLGMDARKEREGAHN